MRPALFILASTALSGAIPDECSHCWCNCEERYCYEKPVYGSSPLQPQQPAIQQQRKQQQEAGAWYNVSMPGSWYSPALVLELLVLERDRNNSSAPASSSSNAAVVNASANAQHANAGSDAGSNASGGASATATGAQPLALYGSSGVRRNGASSSAGAGVLAPTSSLLEPARPNACDEVARKWSCLAAFCGHESKHDPWDPKTSLPIGYRRENAPPPPTAPPPPPRAPGNGTAAAKLTPDANATLPGEGLDASASELNRGVRLDVQCAPWMTVVGLAFVLVATGACACACHQASLADAPRDRHGNLVPPDVCRS